MFVWDYLHTHNTCTRHRRNTHALFLIMITTNLPVSHIVHTLHALILYRTITTTVTLLQGYVHCWLVAYCIYAPFDCHLKRNKEKISLTVNIVLRSCLYWVGEKSRKLTLLHDGWLLLLLWWCCSCCWHEIVVVSAVVVTILSVLCMLDVWERKQLLLCVVVGNKITLYLV